MADPRDDRLKGQVALVTGASRGIGRACARRLASRGAALFLVADGTEDELAAVAADCRARSDGEARYLVSDLSRSEAAVEMVSRCDSEFGRLDVLVNNAGVRCRKRFGDYTAEDYEFVQAVNLRTPFFAAQAAIPVMRRKGGGRIINIASQMGSVMYEDQALYGVTKAGLIYLTKAIAYDWSAEGIHANSVSPGPIATEYNVSRLADNQALRQRMERETTVGRWGTPEAVAEAVEFLATCQGGFIHGHDLLVDGGWTAH
jgi:NAD(P)-dependent dehydrogenase (short-subunit alcohol dehydrogenase family)